MDKSLFAKLLGIVQGEYKINKVSKPLCIRFGYIFQNAKDENCFVSVYINNNPEYDFPPLQESYKDLVLHAFIDRLMRKACKNGSKLFDENNHTFLFYHENYVHESEELIINNFEASIREQLHPYIYIRYIGAELKKISKKGDDKEEKIIDENNASVNIDIPAEIPAKSKEEIEALSKKTENALIALKSWKCTYEENSEMYKMLDSATNIFTELQEDWALRAGQPCTISGATVAKILDNGLSIIRNAIANNTL